MKRIALFVPPLPERLLLEHNFFELYPFDGGGSFIYHELVGTVDDREAAERILNGGVMADFGGFEYLDYQRFECWRSIEKSCWINRMYYIAPLARVARLDGNDQLAARIMKLVLDYARRYPAPAGREAVGDMERRVLEARDRDYNQGGNLDGKTEYQWYDFQPAGRIVNVLNNMYLLRDSAGISEENWREFDDWVKMHAETIYLGEKYYCKLARGNHQALRGTALMYAAAYFKGESFAYEWREQAVKMCNFHMVEDFLPDGILHEISPSYHFFESWISRDAAALAGRYGFELDRGAFEALDRAAAVCRKLRQPDGKSIVINDGYALNTDVFLNTLNMSDAAMPEKDLLPDAGLAFYRSPEFFAVLDASPELGRFSHYHGGKNAVTLWAGNAPFLVDSGCCSYDAPEFAVWFKQPRAHSSLLLDGQGDSTVRGLYEWTGYAGCKLGAWSGDSVESRLISTVPQWRGAAWTRKLTPGAEFVIEDCVELPESRAMTFVFNLHPNVKVELGDSEIILSSGTVKLALSWECDLPLNWELADGKVFENFRIHPSKQLLASAKGARIKLKTVWRHC